MAENLFQRSGTWYVRIQTPKTLRELRRTAGVSGPAEIWRSLGTKDWATAKRRRAQVLNEIYSEFDAETRRLESSGAKPLRVPADHELQQFIWEFTRHELAADELTRTMAPTPEELEALESQIKHQLRNHPPRPGATHLDLLKTDGVLALMCSRERLQTDAERRSILAEELRQHLRENQFVLVDWAIDVAVRTHHWKIEKDSVEYKWLGRKLIQAWLKVIDSADKRDVGNYEDPAPVVPIRADIAKESPNANVVARPKSGEALSDYFDAYLKEKRSHLRSNALKDARATVRQFIECNGNKQVASYTKQDMANFKRQLTLAPARTEKLYPGVSLPKAVELNRRDGHPRLKAASVRNKLTIMSAFGKWLEMNVEGVDASSFSTTLPAREDSERMEPFSQEDVARILNAHAFVGCRSEQNQLEPGPHKVRDWRYWLLMIMAFTGARLNEITQMDVRDIDLVDGVWVFRIQADRPGKSLKTKGSRRLIPLHPVLIELGLLRLRDEVIQAGHEALLHQIPVDRDGRRSHHAGKWFRKFLTRIGVKGEGDLGGAHRWRHTLADALRRGGVDEYEVALLLGHKLDASRMTGHYGREITLTPQRRFELLSRAIYPTVDFDLLK